MAEISQITTVNGTTYDIKDATARQMATGGIQLKGTTTTALTDEATTNPITISGSSYTAVNQDAVFYGKKEFVFDGTKWHEFGDMSGLGSLASKNSASGSFTPAGSVSQPTFTGESLTSSGSYKPEGTVSTPTITVTPDTGTVNSITDVGTLPALTMTVANENLTFGFSQGSLPTKGSNTTVVTGIRSATSTQPTFTGTSKSVSVTGTPEGTVSKPTFTGTQGTVTVQ
jgi:hypothetical protein